MRFRHFGWFGLLLGVGSLLAATPARSPHGDISFTCVSCHDTESWQVDAFPTGFDHAETGFPLQNAHAGTACRACHEELVFSHVGSACADCHLDVHRGQLGWRCDDCHQPTSWDDPLRWRGFHARTRFPLLGAHALVDCDACHRGEQGYDLALPPLECRDCHAADYTAARDPDHREQGYGLACDECHNIFDPIWRAASVNHTGFPLTGAHLTVSCSACHTDGYEGTPSECYACHDDDYHGTTDPPHQAADFETNCETCHTSSGWTPANWDHFPYFPIYRGRHRNEWTSCQDCHVQPDNYLVFECIFCHEHNRSETDSHHDDEPDYEYSSPACLDCHPRGEAD
ncbi:MAG: hypothetical protein ABIF77_05240 [bacterium]